ncbi:hypothetical protein K474DRAFT_1654951 [Panus rudis PR-1116 ss-1]|nr:hypothetical protein K474DRAFT_1654951 [Panus rudis PR-1116 ss-1]
MHNPPRSPTGYPPLEQTWNRLRTWLSNEYPELGDTLNFGIPPQDLADIELSFGFRLPEPVRESYLCVDGQEPESAAGCSEGLFFGLTLLPLEDVLEEWRFWREVDDDPNTGANQQLREMMQSIPPGWVRREYSSRGWIPLVADKAGNYLGVDMNPDEGGAAGQVIVFGRDFDTKVVIWRGDGPGGWAKWLAAFVEELESGEGYEIGAGDASEGSEDSIGYEGYFFDGVGRSQGDGGGDSGTGGMKLTGEYKGWNVLEAWADRSVRKWHEAGLLPDPVVPQQDKGKLPERIDPSALNLPNGTGAEVPIPVLSEDQPSTSSGSSSQPLTIAGSTSAPPPSIPTISVTKPPAPAPVDLPTADDILDVSGPETPEPDLEAGGNIMMREVESPTSSRSPRPTPPSSVSNSTSQAADVPLPSSPKSLSSPSSTPTPNLLEDPAPVIPTPAIAPSPTVSPTRTTMAESSSPKQESPVLVSPQDIALEQTPDTTVRLVGGGGISGTSGSSEDSGVLVSEPDTEAEPEAVYEIPLAGSSETIQKEGKHEKKKSLSSNFKRFSATLGGGKRKKGSISSLKEVVSSSST